MLRDIYNGKSFSLCRRPHQVRNNSSMIIRDTESEEREEQERMFMDAYDRETIKEWVYSLGTEGGEEEGFLDSLTEALWEDKEAGEEFAYFMTTGRFLCKDKVEGYTVADLLVWQIDHFKAEMDRGKYDFKYNGYTMVLRAFDTLLKMKAEPEKYKWRIMVESGTDYPEKY